MSLYMGIEEEESERLFWHGRKKNEKVEGKGREEKKHGVTGK